VRTDLYYILCASLITGTKLEVHRVSPVSAPIPAPLEAGVAEDFDYLGIHVSCRPLQIRLRIQINGNSPTVRRKLNTGPLRPECKTPTEAFTFACSSSAKIFANTFPKTAVSRLWQAN